MVDNLKFWCQKVLPLVYDDSLSYYEVLCKVVGKINEIIPIVNVTDNKIEESIIRILNEWKEDGTFDRIINEELFGSLNTKVNKNADRIEKMMPSNLKDEKCILIGNSYMYGSGATANQGWGYWFTGYTGCDSTIIQQRSGDFCAMGSQYADYPNMTYLQALQAKEASFTESYKKQVKWVIVGGGLNDHTFSGEEIVEAIRLFALHVRATYPNANLAIIPLGGAKPERIRNATQCLYDWSRGATLCGALTSTDTVTNHYGRGLATSNEGDTAHLNEDGYKVCAREIQSIIYGNAVPYTYVNTVLNPTSDFTLAQGQYIRATRNGNRVSIIAWGSVENVADNTVLINLPEIFTPVYTNRLTVNATAVKSTGLYDSSVGFRVPLDVIVSNTGKIEISSPTTNPVSASIFMNLYYDIV